MLTYCLKCKEKTETKDPTEIVMSNGRHAISGICEVCGGKKTSIVSGKK